MLIGDGLGPLLCFVCFETQDNGAATVYSIGREENNVENDGPALSSLSHFIG